ncbi:glutamate--cysteine ligase [Zavarzinia compransoris]|uniref:Glutamate--cysteine ligase n=1 Tax=Zavarzinia compransoris TaxID=1264899 RepID=A0A317DYM9_9PROT|nr:glutamate--cysteine ligase [Zavarzinia compransoris]PWR19857.1 glutamate--cysteine ligase [Zavarzinia compransoris]TDP45032.1 glutamate--cysteine ligase [Zavarzinia compransoris]
MSGIQTAGAPIENRQQLVDWMAGGGKPKAEWRIGTEHEKFGFRLDDLGPVPYDGDRGIRAMLEGLRRFGWAPVLEGDHIIALEANGASISLEPGGQFELSGAPLQTIHETCGEVATHLEQVQTVARELGLGFIGLGFAPTWKREEVPVMPKGRYDIMRAYMPKKGNLGLDMMLRTSTVQVNLDFASEADMVAKLRVALALQPVATALFANSPFTEGRPNGFQSYRAHIWSDTDPDRTGLLPFAFEDGFGFEAYVEWALDVPMYFVYRDDRYIDASGQSFRDFLDGRLPALPGEKPHLGDWSAHLTTLFPEARVKRYIEMRGADGGPWKRLCALPAFWVGLVYDDQALAACLDLVKDWTAEERQALRAAVPRLGLRAPFRRGTVLDLARPLVEIADAGLKRRAAVNGLGSDETLFIEVLKKTVDSGRSPADDLLDAYQNRWHGDITRLFAEYAY